MGEYTVTISGVDDEKLREAVTIAVDAVRDALEEAGLGDLEVTTAEAEEPTTTA